MQNTTRPLKQTTAYKAFRKGGKNLRKNIKRFLLKRKFKDGTPIFVYQMGKVASSSVEHSLKDQYTGAIGHAHHIGSDNWGSELFYDWYKQGNALKIISPVREPIGRNIAEFFELFEKFTGKPFDESNHTVDELIEIFLEKYTHDLPLTWFDDNIKKHFGIDVYQTPFPLDGIEIYTLGKIGLLVFKTETENSKIENAVREFVGLPDFSLNNANVSKNKTYNTMYKSFINSFKPPKTYLDKIKSSKYLNHFYTNDEVEDILSRWK